MYSRLTENSFNFYLMHLGGRKLLPFIIERPEEVGEEVKEGSFYTIQPSTYIP